MDAPTVGLMRNLGRFIGHVMAGVQATPSSAARREVRRETTESRGEGVVLRRTVIEEVEVPRASAPSDSARDPGHEHHAP